MRTAREMDEYALAHGYIYTGNSALKHFEVVEKILMPNEEVLMALAPNSVYNGTQIVMGGVTAVVFTNKRLIYGQKAIFMGAPVKIVNLEHINDVQKDTWGITDGKIFIDTLKENIGLRFNKSDLDRIFVNIMEILENYKASKAAAISPISTADEIKKYKELLEIGAITQEEFDAKKKQLLNL